MMNEEILNSELTDIKPFEMDEKPHKDTIQKIDIPEISVPSQPECVVCATTSPETSYIYTSSTKLNTSLSVFVQTFIKPSWKLEDPSKCISICKSCLDVVNNLESVQMQFKIHGYESTDSNSDSELPKKRSKTSKEMPPMQKNCYLSVNLPNFNDVANKMVENKQKFTKLYDKFQIFQNSKTDPDRVNKSSFDCNICERKYFQFSFGRDLAKETWSDAPLDCLICQRLFVYKPSKKRKSLTDYKPFGCMLCRCRFGQQEALEQHLKYHTRQLPYQCHACELTFQKRPQLLAHLKDCRLCVCGIQCYQFLVTKTP